MLILVDGPRMYTYLVSDCFQNLSDLGVAAACAIICGVITLTLHALRGYLSHRQADFGQSCVCPLEPIFCSQKTVLGQLPPSSFCCKLLVLKSSLPSVHV